MVAAPLPPDKRGRLGRLRPYGILDTADETAYDDHQVRLSVRDTGVGIPHEVHSSLFD